MSKGTFFLPWSVSPIFVSKETSNNNIDFTQDFHRKYVKIFENTLSAKLIFSNAMVSISLTLTSTLCKVTNFATKTKHQKLLMILFHTGPIISIAKQTNMKFHICLMVLTAKMSRTPSEENSMNSRETHVSNLLKFHGSQNQLDHLLENTTTFSP